MTVRTAGQRGQSWAKDGQRVNADPGQHVRRKRPCPPDAASRRKFLERTFRHRLFRVESLEVVERLLRGRQTRLHTIRNADAPVRAAREVQSLVPRRRFLDLRHATLMADVVLRHAPEPAMNPPQ